MCVRALCGHQGFSDSRVQGWLPGENTPLINSKVYSSLPHPNQTSLDAHEETESAAGTSGCLEGSALLKLGCATQWPQANDG